MLLAHKGMKNIKWDQTKIEKSYSLNKDIFNTPTFSIASTITDRIQDGIHHKGVHKKLFLKKIHPKILVCILQSR